MTAVFVSFIRVGSKVGTELAMTLRNFDSNFKEQIRAEQMCVRVLAARCARALLRHPQETRGRREDRVRAAPAVSRAIVLLAKTHTSIQVQRRQSGLPCAMVLRLITCSRRGAEL